LCRYFAQTYVAANFVVVAVGNLQHERVQELLEKALAGAPHDGPAADHSAPVVAPVIQVRKKELEQSHIVFGTEALPQHHPDRYAGYALNTTLGGSMSSRLFQNVREKRGLAYSVFSGLSAYQDAGALSIYAGCANDAVAELIDVVVAEIRQMKAGGLDPVELRRAKDHLKGSLMLGLESTSSRMSHLARQEMYRDHTTGLDEMLASIEKVTASDVLQLADKFFSNGSLAVTVLGNVNGLQLTKEQLAL
jgi:predicted Zn-dependent peptidase